MTTKHIKVEKRIATYDENDGIIVCGNECYRAEFDFDSEWDAYEKKKASFVFWHKGVYKRINVEFKGNICPIPPIYNTKFVEVGVFVDNALRTTSEAVIPCRKSILCKDAQDILKMDEIDALNRAVIAYIEANYSDGKSAYEIAVEKGFQGTEDEWLAQWATREDVNNLREVAEGKCQTFTVQSLSSMLTLLNATPAPSGHNYDYVGTNLSFKGKTLKTGDVILIRQLDVPDYWCDVGTDAVYLCPLETTKIDLDNYLEKDTSTSTKKKVYAKLEDGTNDLIPCSTSRSPNEIAIRDQSGNFGVSDPVNDMHCVNKGYAEKHYQPILNFDSNPTENSKNPITSGGVYDILQNGFQVINGKRLATGETDSIGQTAYGEYEIYGNGATVTYNGNSYSGRFHQIMLYSTKLSDGSTDTRYRHISVGSSVLSGYNVEYGTLRSNVDIVANDLSFFVTKKMLSGVNPSEMYELVEKVDSMEANINSLQENLVGVAEILTEVVDGGAF